MIKEAIKEAETIEEAKALALAELGVNEDKAQFEVLVQPEKKKVWFVWWFTCKGKSIL